MTGSIQPLQKLGVALLLLSCTYGCGLVESAESKQLKACLADIKIGLNDPESLEVLSTRPIDMSGKGHRLEVIFTAKNKFGGRVRGKEVCGFKTKTDVALDPEDYQNSLRFVARGLRDLGIRTK